MTRRTTALLALLLGSVAACGAPADPFVLFEEDFEDACEGAPCGWAQIAGPEGAARYVETLPGDHGLELIGDGVTVRGGGGELEPALYRQLSARAFARCDAGSILDLRTTLELRGGGIVSFEASFTPRSDWSEPVPDETLVTPDGVPPPWELVRVLGISMRKLGPGSCEIDYLAVRSDRAF